MMGKLTMVVSGRGHVGVCGRASRWSAEAENMLKISENSWKWLKVVKNNRK